VGIVFTMRWARGRSVAVLLATVFSAACYWADWRSPVRIAATAVFLLFVPGLAIAELARVPDALLRLVVGLGASLALETLLSVAFLYTGAFTPSRVFAAVLLMTVAAAAVTLAQPAGGT
jgi:hypothetical protein